MEREQIIEEVAKAIYAKWSRTVDPSKLEFRWNRMMPGSQQEFRNEAEAAIETYEKLRGQS